MVDIRNEVSSLYASLSQCMNSENIYERIPCDEDDDSLDTTGESADVNENYECRTQVSSERQTHEFKNYAAELLDDSDVTDPLLKSNISPSGFDKRSVFKPPRTTGTDEKESNNGSAYFSVKDVHSFESGTTKSLPDLNGIHARTNRNTTTHRKCVEGDIVPKQNDHVLSNEQQSTSTTSLKVPVDRLTYFDIDSGLSRRYPVYIIDTIRRCDRLINSLQRQNQVNIDLISTTIQFRKLVYVLTVGNVILVLAIFVLLTAYSLSRGDTDLVQGAMLQTLNRRPKTTATLTMKYGTTFYSHHTLTSESKRSLPFHAFANTADPDQNSVMVVYEIIPDVSALKDEYLRVSGLVNDLLTRSRSVIYLTSDHQHDDTGESHTVKWIGGQDIYSKGNLELSHNGQHVVISSGAFYDIYCNIHFSANVNETKELSFAYELVHLRGGHGVYEEHTFQRQTVLKGRVRQGVTLQTTRYLLIDDVIAVKVKADYWPHVAKYQGASKLIMHELT